MTIASNNTATDNQSQELVQILRHANGSFDVLYNQPPNDVPEAGWMYQVVAVLRGVVMSVVNRDNNNESACHYRDGADYNRAVVFLNQMHESFPELQELQELLVDPNYSDLMDFYDPIVNLLRSMSQSRRAQFCASFQTILLSSSVVTNNVGVARGLVTVTALFGEKQVKVRLTGKIPEGIAEVLRAPYWFVVGDNRNSRSPVKNDRQSPNREAFKQDLKALRDTAVSTYNKLSAESGLMLTHAQVGSLRSKLLAAVDSFMKEVQTTTAHEDTGQQQQKAQPRDRKPAVTSQDQTRKVEQQRRQSGTSSNKMHRLAQEQQQLNDAETANQGTAIGAGTYPRGQTPVLVNIDDAGYVSDSKLAENTVLYRVNKSPIRTVTPANEDATVEHQHRDIGGTADTATLMPENGHVVEVPVKPKRVKNDGVKSAFADKLASALKLRGDSPSEQELVTLDTALEQGQSSDSNPDVETAMDNGGQFLHSGN